MLDWRIYRLAWLPVVIAALVMAFSLESRPAPRTTTFAAEAFDGQRAFSELRELAARFPSREPGSAGDDRLAGRVAAVFRGAGLDVRREEFTAGTSVGRQDMVNIVGVRPGTSERRIVIVAHRDALTSPATAQLSGTAALLELARVFAGRRLTSTVVLASTTAGSAGSAGAEKLIGTWADPDDIVIAVGDLAGLQLRRPYVVPWSDGEGVAPLMLRRTVESAVRAEVDQPTGDPGVPSQFARLAFPLALGEQAPMLRAGIGSVLLQVSGEKGPGPETKVNEERLEDFGRALLRAITAIDETNQQAQSPEHSLLVTDRKVLPGWTVRLLVGTLLLPVLLCSLDAWFRASRRAGPAASWLGWSIAGALPFLIVVGLLLVLGSLGLVPATPSIPPPDSVPWNAGAIAAMVAAVLLLVVGFLLVWPVAKRVVGARGDPGIDPRAAVSVALLMAILATAIWFANAYAAALLVPAAHLWLIGLTAGEQPRRSVAIPAVLLGLVPPVLVGIYYGLALGLGPVDLPTWLLAVVSGNALGLPWLLLWSMTLGCTAAALVVAWRGHAPLDAPSPPPRITGTPPPLEFVGPGPLSGTESALRR